MMGAGDFTLSSEFWEKFFQRYWEKRPVVIKNPFGKSFAGEEEIFAALVRAGGQFRAGEHTINPRFSVEHGLLLTDVEKKMPVIDDRAISGYAARLSRELEGRAFELIVNRFHTHSAELWMRMRGFFRGLHELIGIPAYNLEATLFLRNHAVTSFGIHKDTASIFAFVIAGRKKMLVWPEEYFRDKEVTFNSLDYEKFSDGAISVEGEAGDILYWPSSYWHVGEAGSGLSLTMNVGLFLKHNPFADILKHVRGIARDRPDASATVDLYAFDPNAPERTAERVAKELEAAADILREISRSAALEESLRISWMNRVTGAGFTSVPPPLPHAALSDDQTLSANPLYPVVWLNWNDNKLACSANGHSFAVTRDPSAIKLIERVNTGAPFGVKGLVEECSETNQASDERFLRGIVEKLYSLRAIADCDMLSE